MVFRTRSVYSYIDHLSMGTYATVRGSFGMLALRPTSGHAAHSILSLVAICTI